MTTNDSRRAQPRPAPDARPGPQDRPAPRARRRAPFDKELATLWLLTIVLGLGLGAVVRLMQRSNQAATAARASQLTALQAAAPSYGSPGSPLPYSQNQRVAVVPQQSLPVRGTTRMS